VACIKVPLGAGTGLPVLQPQRPDWQGMLSDRMPAGQRPQQPPPAG